VADRLLLIGGDADLLRAAGDSFERLGYDLAREATGEGGVEGVSRYMMDATCTGEGHGTSR